MKERLSINDTKFVEKMESELYKKEKHHKTSVEKLAATFGITNQNEVKELTEFAIVRTARRIIDNPSESNYNTFLKIVELYNNQVTLSHRTSHSTLFQQYSTPAPLAFVAGLYVKQHQTNKEQIKDLYFEPSAGNGLLTIAIPYNEIFVNEIDNVRLANLKSQPFAVITSKDASFPLTEYYKKFDGIITNPPFDSLKDAVDYHSFPIKTLDHLMALRALDCMKDNGKAAIIIGGHTDWDEKDRVQAGKNRIFFNYLYHHYHVDDVILIDGHKLYAKQGTAFDVRLILIDGRKTEPVNYAPLKSDKLAQVVKSFEELWERVNLSDDVMEKSDGVMEIKKTSNQRFSDITYLHRKQIMVNPETFQGRQKKFSQETVDKIVSEGFDKSNDPIIVWYDETIDKYIVISGHSRWEASEILYHQGVKSLAEMPVKIFLGDKSEAQSYAIIESNRASTNEGFLSDLKAVKKMLKEAYAKTEMLKYVKPKSYLEKLINYSYLNEKGKFIDYLNSESKISFPYLERNAEWVGILRKLNEDKITNAHETELFNYLYQNDKKSLAITKDEFFKLIENKVYKLDFNRDEPLNLHSIVSTSALTSDLAQEIKESQKEIEKLNKEIDRKQDLIIVAKQDASKAKLADKFEKDIFNLNQQILIIKENIARKEKDIKKIENTTSFDLFSQQEEEEIKPTKNKTPIIETQPENSKVKTVDKAQFSGKGWTPSLSVRAFENGENKVWFVQIKPTDHIFNIPNGQERINFQASFFAAKDLGFEIGFYQAGKYGRVYVFEKDNKLLTLKSFNQLSEKEIISSNPTISLIKMKLKLKSKALELLNI